jgi:nicotinamidase/pyrazinamidase
MKMYVDVDTQLDFCDPRGALFVRGAPAVMHNIRALIQRSVSEGSLLVGSIDTHDFTAWEFAKNGGPFPPHCVKGTPGWLKMEGTLVERSVWIPNVEHQPKIPANPGAILFEKEVYSLFANPIAERTLDELIQRPRREVTAVVFGVATDYCVKAAALGLKERGYDVEVVEDAIAAVAPDTGERALAEMRAAGVRFVSTRSLA